MTVEKSSRGGRREGERSIRKENAKEWNKQVGFDKRGLRGRREKGRSHDSKRLKMT